MKLVIQGQLPNLNDYTKACRANRYVGAKMKKEAEEMILFYILSQLNHQTTNCPVRLKFSWYEKNKKRDLDNIAFAKKFILDALVSSQTIKSDNWSGVVGFTDEFYVDKDNPRIEVEIKEVKNMVSPGIARIYFDKFKEAIDELIEDEYDELDLATRACGDVLDDIRNNLEYTSPIMDAVEEACFDDCYEDLVNYADEALNKAIKKLKADEAELKELNQEFERSRL
jgi:Holliday junction resolvase RusA-like endonuclease